MSINTISIADFHKLSDIEINRLNLFISESPDATIFHLIEWNKCISRVFGTKFECGILKNINGEILALIPYHITKCKQNCNNIYSPPFMYEVPYGGFLFGGEKVNSHKEIINNFLQYITTLYKNSAFFVIGIPGQKIDFSNSNYKVRILRTPIINLVPEENEIWASFNPKRRNMIRKAEKNKIEIIRGGIELLEDYYKMVISLYKKLNKPPLSFEYYSEILKTFYQNGNASIFLSKHQDRFLSGGIFLKYKSTGYYWHGASYDNTPNLGQNEVIQWEVMKRFKSEGCIKYDLVRVDQEKLPNIALFKMGFTNVTEEFYDLYYVTFKNRIIRKLMSFL